MTNIEATEGGRPVSEMQRRIARALCERNCIRPWDEQPKAVREGFLSDALAAMKAMPEPTLEMLAVGDQCELYAGGIWRAMLDAEISIAEGGKDD